MKNLRLIVLCFLFLAGCASQQARQPDIDSLPPTAAQSYQLSVDFWSGIGGKAVRNLTRNARFPGTPTSSTPIQTLDFNQTKGNKYGERIAGLLTVPDTGDYTFWIAADDSAELWLSTDQFPYNKRLIAFTNKPTGYQLWTTFKVQKSKKITLETGKQYFLEVLHKQNAGEDYLSVSWRGPGFTQAILDSANLTAYQVAGSMSDNIVYKDGYRVGYASGTYQIAYDDTFPAPDADQDGLPDAYEVAIGLDPNNPDDALSDMDNDLLTAYDEYFLLSDPRNPDTDGDGMRDGFEWAYGLNALNATDAALDLDGDGVSNLDEFLANTNPSDATSLPGGTSTGGSGSTSTSIVVSWNVPATREDGSPLAAGDIASYEVYFGTDPGSLTLNGTVAGTLTNYNLTGLSAGTYYVAVKVVDTAGMASNLSGVVGFTTDGTTGQMFVVDGAGTATGNTAKSGTTTTVVSSSSTTGATTTATSSSSTTPIDTVTSTAGATTGTNSTETGSTSSTTGPTAVNVSLSWSIPTSRIDGTVLAASDIQQFQVYSGSDPAALSLQNTINGANINSYTTTFTSPGTYYFAVSVVDTSGQVSDLSALAAVYFDGVTAQVLDTTGGAVAP